MFIVVVKQATRSELNNVIKAMNQDMNDGESADQREGSRLRIPPKMHASFTTLIAASGDPY